MKTTEFYSALLREKYLRIEHPSGLSVYVFPKKLNSTYAILTTNFGSVDQGFRPAGSPDTVKLPDGIAHFLEHKLFENEDGSDSFERFAALGADANAYTSYTRTSYLFSCTANFESALEELLRFVTSPHFSAASVKKEQGIIAQEIREYEDSPWEQCYQQLMETMYEIHPARNNICGSVTSIASITAEQLYECHRLFYNLANMALVVCGDVTPEQVMAVVDRTLPTEATPLAFERVAPTEPPHTKAAFVEGHMPVSKPIFCIGIKDPFVPADATERLRRDMALTLLDEILFSRAGEFYNTLFEEGIVTPTFSGGYSCCENFGFHAISGESDTPEAVLERIKAYLEKLRHEGIDEGEMERCRRVLYADELRSYDSTEDIANRLTAFVFEGTDMFSFPSMLQKITKQELEALLDEVFADAYITLSVIRPLESDKERN